MLALLSHPLPLKVWLLTLHWCLFAKCNILYTYVYNVIHINIQKQLMYQQKQINIKTYNHVYQFLYFYVRNIIHYSTVPTWSSLALGASPVDIGRGSPGAWRSINGICMAALCEPRKERDWQKKLGLRNWAHTLRFLDMKLRFFSRTKSHVYNYIRILEYKTLRGYIYIYNIVSIAFYIAGKRGPRIASSLKFLEIHVNITDCHICTKTFRNIEALSRHEKHIMPWCERKGCMYFDVGEFILNLWL